MSLAENAKPSPLEKGDRGAVDKDYLGMKNRRHPSVKALPLGEGAAKPGIECLEEA